VTDYLERYAARLDVEIQTNTRVETIQQDGKAFLVLTEDGRVVPASGIVAESGSFSNAYRPSFPGEEACTGELSHVADHRNPAPYVGQRVIVVGAGDSAAQVANELAPLATVGAKQDDRPLVGGRRRSRRCRRLGSRALACGSPNGSRA